jgi:flagellar motor switch protein FliM
VALNTITLNPNFTIINGRIIVLFIENIFDYFKDSWNEKIGQTLEVMVFMLSTLFQEYRGGQFYW